MAPSAALLERARRGEVATEAQDEAERSAAWALLAALEKRGKASREDVVRSLTVPRGEAYLESTLVRFLRARDGNADKACDMIETALETRRRWDVDNILSKPLGQELLRKVHSGVYDGLLPTFDRFGRPVYCLQGGRSNKAIPMLHKPPPSSESWSMRDLEDAWLHWHLTFIEFLTTVLMARATERAGKLINKYVIVDDLKGFSASGLKALHGIMPIFAKSAAIDQLLYPELLGMFMFIHSPAVFRGAWTVIKGFLDPGTCAKIFVLGGDAQFKPAVDALFEPAAIPPFVGGTLPGTHVTSLEEPRCDVYDAIDRQVLEAGKARGFPTALRSKALSCVHVSAGKTAEAKHEAAAGALIEWHVAVDAHDVHVAVDFVHAAGGETVQLEADRKADARELPVTGVFQAPAVGVLRVYDGLLPTFDRFGRPVYCLQGGRSNKAIPMLHKPPPSSESWSMRDLEDAWLHWHLTFIEFLTTVLMARATERAGKLINKYVIVDDLKGFSASGLKALHGIMPIFAKSAAIDQLLYPELLGMFMFIHSPAVFRGAWTVIKGFLDPGTCAKIFVLGGDAQFKPAVDALFEPAAIPPFVGGTLPGTHVTSLEEPRCDVYDAIDRQVLEAGKARGFPTALRSKALSCVHVSAGKTAEAKHEAAAGALIEWHVAVDAHDVHVAVDFVHAAGGKTVQLEADRKADARELPVTGVFQAPAVGVLRVSLSNKHSRMRSKTVRYRIFAYHPESVPASVEATPPLAPPLAPAGGAASAQPTPSACTTEAPSTDDADGSKDEASAAQAPAKAEAADLAEAPAKAEAANLAVAPAKAEAANLADPSPKAEAADVADAPPKAEAADKPAAAPAAATVAAGEEAASGQEDRTSQ